MRSIPYKHLAFPRLYGSRIYFIVPCFGAVFRYSYVTKIPNRSRHPSNMNLKDRIGNNEYKNPQLERIIKALSRISDSVRLKQDTADTAQLNPVERLRSIEKYG